MLLILKEIVYDGSFVLNGLLVTLIVAFLSVSILRIFVVVRMNLQHSFGFAWKLYDTFTWAVYWDHYGRWAKANFWLFVSMLVAFVFEAAYYFVYLA